MVEKFTVRTIPATLLALFAFASVPRAVAAEPERFYYIGEVKLSSPAGEPRGSQVILFEKTHDPDDSVITARKKVTGPDGKVFMYMDMSLQAITPKTFEILKAGLLKK